jgi:CheY-like chemotaxis protein
VRTGALRLVHTGAGADAFLAIVGRAMTEPNAEPDEARSLEARAHRAAHDLNNLLFVMLAHCELLEARLPVGSTDRLSLDSIRAAADQAIVVTKALVADADPVDSPDGIPRAPAAPAMRVLVVDEDEAVRRLVDRVLTPQGITVTTASTRDDALGALAGHADLSLVILGVSLGRGYGLALIDLVAEVDPTLPVLVLTGHDPTAVAQHLESRAVAAYLAKPFTPAQLRDATATHARLRS